LGDVVVEAGLVDRPDGVLVPGLAGDEDGADQLVVSGRGELDEEVDAALTGQAMVGQDEGEEVPVGVDLGEHFAGVGDVLGRLDPHDVGEDLEVALDGLAHLGLVLEDHDGESHERPSWGRGGGWAGSSMVKTVSPGRDRTEMVPPWSVTARRA